MSEFSILVVEDDAMLALAMEDILQKLGYKNLEFAFDLTGALKIAENRRFSIAFLDVNLNGELSLPLVCCDSIIFPSILRQDLVRALIMKICRELRSSGNHIPSRI